MSGLETFYLVCFVVGLVLTILSFSLGHLHIHFHVESIHGAGHSFGNGLAHTHDGLSSHSTSEFSAINPTTVMAFLTWFGGMGFLLTFYYPVELLIGFGIAAFCGLMGAASVFFFMAKVLLPHQSQLDPADYEMTGTLARVSSSIRENGTGEIIFSQAGVRKTSGARSEDGSPIEKGVEVVVTKYERGIAYVQKWEEFVR